jgi:hypothetical protein
MRTLPFLPSLVVISTQFIIRIELLSSRRILTMTEILAKTIHGLRGSAIQRGHQVISCTWAFSFFFC